MANFTDHLINHIIFYLFPFTLYPLAPYFRRLHHRSSHSHQYTRNSLLIVNYTLFDGLLFYSRARILNRSKEALY